MLIAPHPRGVYESQAARKESKGSAKKTGAVPSAHHMPLLNASGIIKRFGDFMTNDDVSFSIYKEKYTPCLGRTARENQPL